MQLSQKVFSQFFSAFWKSRENFEQFQKMMTHVTDVFFNFLQKTW